MCETLVRALVDNGHEVDVVTSGMKDLPAVEEHGRLRIFRVKCFRRNRYYSTIPELLTQVLPSYFKALQLTKENRYDCNHTHFVVPSGIVAYMLKRKTGLPYVLTAHGSDIPGYNPDRFKWAHNLIQPVWKRVVEYSDALSSASEFLKGLVQLRTDRAVSVIPNAYDLPAADAGRKIKRVLVASRLVERKGVQFLIEASDVVGDDWEICIAGDGPYLTELKRIAGKSTRPIRFLGFLDHGALVELYKSSSIFVFPSLQENFPMVLLEAMAAGCAVITTTAQGCIEVVGDAAITTAPGDVNELRAALSELTNDAEKTEQYGRRALQRAGQFSAQNVCAQLETLYAEVARNFDSENQRH